MSNLQELKNKLCPNGVEFRKLGEICNFIRNGIQYKPNKDRDKKYKVSRIETISEGIINMEKVASFDIPLDSNYLLQTGDILFSHINSLPHLGKIAYYEASIGELYHGMNLLCFRVNEKIILSKYLYFYLKTSFFRKYIDKYARRSCNQYSLTLSNIKSIEIPIPPLEVQAEIVRILDTFTELIKELIKEHELRKKQYSYYRDKLLTFETDIKKVKLGNIGKISMCRRIMKNETNSVSGVPFYKIGTFGGNPDSYISEELFEEYSSKYPYPKKGYILISTSGTIGKLVVFDGLPAYFQDSNIVWVDNDEDIVLNKYLYHIYKTSPWKITKGGIIARLYNGDIANTEIPLPPLDTQKRIVDILDNFEKYTNDLQEGLPAEIEKRKKQYAYYRDELLRFERK